MPHPPPLRHPHRDPILGADPGPTAADGTRVLVLLAHPDLRRSRVNRCLKERIQVASSQASAPLNPPGAGNAAYPRIEVRDLYALYPDYAIDVAAEQHAAEAADLIAWVHPIQWYSMPALMKLWVDDVLSVGWAYGPGGRALAGKDLWLVTSTGARQAAYHPSGYNRHFFDAFLPPYEQTAALCGLRFLPPLVLHGAHAADDADIAAHADVFMQRLATYPDWPEIADLLADDSCVAPAQDRPAPEPPALGEDTLPVAASPADLGVAP